MISQYGPWGFPQLHLQLGIGSPGVLTYCIILISCYSITMIMISRSANCNQLVTYSAPAGHLKRCPFLCLNFKIRVYLIEITRKFKKSLAFSSAGGFFYDLAQQCFILANIFLVLSLSVCLRSIALWRATIIYRSF